MWLLEHEPVVLYAVDTREESNDLQSVLAVYDGVRRVDLRIKNQEIIGEMLRHAGKH